MILNDNTPIEEYRIEDRIIHVKREDLCTPSPGPTFSKVRGLLKRLQTLKSERIEVVGYTESSVSMAGWGIAWLAPKVGLKTIIYDPQYSVEQDHLKVLNFHRSKWKELDAEIIPIKAGMVKVNYNICKKDLAQRYSNSVMLPLGLPFQETIDETARIASQYDRKFKSVVVCIGSGTICAGIIKGMPSAHVYGIMSRSGNIFNRRKSILSKAVILDHGLIGSNLDFDCIDPGWEYTQRSYIDCPFPTHPYYDLKAFEWIIKHIDELQEPILFWNIGS